MNLIQKLAKIRREIHNVEKRGLNKFHDYHYAQASDVAGIIGTALAEHNIIVARRNLKVTSIDPDPAVKDGPKETIVRIECEYGFIDGDGPWFAADGDAILGELWQPAFGEGRDRGDKAGYKAFTGALKYFLVQAFLLATGDDPEASGDEEREEKPTPKGKLDLKPDAPKSEPKVPATMAQINEIIELATQSGSDITRLLGHYGHPYDDSKDLAANFLGRFTLNNYTSAKERMEKALKRAD